MSDNVPERAVPAHGSDVCECGDFRCEHAADGKCRVCGNRTGGGDGCTGFRFSHAANEIEYKVWNTYHANHCGGAVPTKKNTDMGEVERVAGELRALLDFKP